MACVARPVAAPGLAMPTESELFAMLDAARELCEDYAPPPAPKPRHTFKLADGTIHLCGRDHCKTAEMNYLSGDFVCKHTGFVVGRVAVRDDFSTGRQTGSCNPDDTAGGPKGGQWTKKTDSFTLSCEAYRDAEAEQTKEEEGTLFVSPGKDPKTCVKRGARCVDEEPSERDAPCPKRQKQARIMDENEDAQRSLLQDAEVTLDKLVRHEKKQSKTSTVLTDQNQLFRAALKRYLKDAGLKGERVTLDSVHNLALTSSLIAKQERQKQAAEQGGAALILKVRMRNLITRLAVTLWSACCKTPHLTEKHRSDASFRPFVCGILYALKRGVKLRTGVAVVPACPLLAEALPVLRGTAQHSQAKALHASSHRGLCTLHKSIASCTDDQAQTIFLTASRICASLAEAVANGSYDL